MPQQKSPCWPVGNQNIYQNIDTKSSWKGIIWDIKKMKIERNWLSFNGGLKREINAFIL
jgi:hypothetical protein